MKKKPDQTRSVHSKALINVYENMPQDYDGTCLRPLGLCELGGCCDVCIYNPENRKHKSSQY